MSTHGKKILKSGVDTCIVKDHKCPIIDEFDKQACTTADGGLLVS